MGTKERERAHFEWQKSFNLYMILLTLIIFLVSTLDKLQGLAKLLSLWVLGFSISFFGLAIIILNANELIYTWNHLRDERRKVTKFQKYFSLVIYLFIVSAGFLIMLSGIYFLFVLVGFFPNPLV